MHLSEVPFAVKGRNKQLHRFLFLEFCGDSLLVSGHENFMVKPYGNCTEPPQLVITVNAQHSQ